MYEKDMVKSTLNRCQERGYCQLDDKMVASLEGFLDVVLNVLHAKDKRAFQMAQNMVLILYDVLTAKNESELDGYQESFDKDQFEALFGLYSLSKTEADCREALVHLHMTFCGRCSGLARENEYGHRQRLLSAENDPNMANKLEELRGKAKKAADDYEKVCGFVAEHRIEEVSAHKLKMGW